MPVTFPGNNFIIEAKEGNKGDFTATLKYVDNTGAAAIHPDSTADTLTLEQLCQLVADTALRPSFTDSAIRRAVRLLDSVDTKNVDVSVKKGLIGVKDQASKVLVSSKRKSGKVTVTINEEEIILTNPEYKQVAGKYLESLKHRLNADEEE